MTIIYKYLIPLMSVLFFALVLSCKEKYSEQDEHMHTDAADDHSDDAHVQGEIHLTKKQIEAIQLKFGKLSNIKINDFVKATGTLGLPPNALNSVSAKAEGFIKNSNKYVEGSYVKKGIIMAYLENPEFIRLQQQYLEVAADLVYDRQELNRQRKLLQANAGIEKNVQKLQSTINMKTATLKGIAKQLNYLGIRVEQLTTDNIQERIPIYAPMSGYITSIKMHNGRYVTPEMELMEIVNENHLHLELDIFEKDISKIVEEQAISYIVPALGNTVYEGEVHIIGKEFNSENKTVRIHGHLGKKRPKFIKDLFVEAKIWLNDQTVRALPEKAIIKDGQSSYIYIANPDTEDDEIKFYKILVKPGVTDKGFTSVNILDTIPEDMQIVTEGAFFVYAQSKSGELSHDH